MNISLVDPKRLSSVLELLDTDDNVWLARDLGAILKHQLRVPLVFDTSGLDELSSDNQGDIETSADPIDSLADLLKSPNPPLPLLQSAKQFCKEASTGVDRHLPPEVANVLYYAVILAALLRCGQRISGLSDRELLKGVRWGLAQEWLDGLTRMVLSDGMRFLSNCQDE